MGTKPRVRVNWGLRFYSEVLGLEHLHYGIWNGEALTLNGLRKAQERYVDRIVELVPEGVRRILDVGCGLAYPVPWATDKSTSRLARPEHYIQALKAAGFKVSTHNNRRQFPPGFIKQLRLKTEAGGGPPPLGLHILMQDGAAAKFKNSADSIAADLIAPVEVIAQK